MLRRLLIATVAALSVAFIAIPSANAQGIAAPGRPGSGASLGAVGLALLAGGFLTATPGIIVLAACKEGEPCHSDATTALGWLLAGPGIPPIVIGAFFLWLDKPHGRASLNSAPIAKPFPLQISGGPLPSGGGALCARYSF